MFLIDFILHVDQHLAEFVANYGLWIYAILFLIVFVETGVVVMPFLPGDSLLFAAGALAAIGLVGKRPESILMRARCGIPGVLCVTPRPSWKKFR